MVSAIRCNAIGALDSVFCAPVRYVSQKIQTLAETIFGYLLRIITFQVGEMNTPGAAYVIRFYQQFTYDPRDKLAYDPSRLQKSRELLIEFGGQPASLTPDDQSATIDSLTFKSEDFFNRLRGERQDITINDRNRQVLLGVSKETIKKFRIPEINIQMPDGTLQKGALLPDAPEPNARRRVVMLCHSPGRAACMGREEIARHLMAGHDVVIWDPRGTALSTGIASEGGYYLDAEAVYNHIIAQGYDPTEVYVSGYCKGAACAVHVKKKFHHLGVNLIMGNPYTSMKEVVESYGWLGRFAARYGLPAIQSRDERITRNVQQDYFDNVAKLKDLRPSNGKFIFIHTDTDKMMPRGTVSRLIEAVYKAGPFHEILHVHKNPNENGHMTPPDLNEQVQWRLYSLIT